MPKFSWEQDENALGYEIEIYETLTVNRVGIFQYDKSSVCIEGACELVLKNTRDDMLEIPYIPLIEHTAVQEEAPYQADLQSPVLDVENLSTYSHEWSVEGVFEKFPDTPEFIYTFDDPGQYTVNVLVTSAEGRVEYAYATVDVTEPTIEVTTEISAEASVDEEDTVPDVQAALPVQPEESADLDNTAVELAAPEVSVSNQNPVVAALPETTQRKSQE